MPLMSSYDRVFGNMNLTRASINSKYRILRLRIIFPHRMHLFLIRCHRLVLQQHFQMFWWHLSMLHCHLHQIRGSQLHHTTVCMVVATAVGVQSHITINKKMLAVIEGSNYFGQYLNGIDYQYPHLEEQSFFSLPTAVKIQHNFRFLIEVLSHG